MNKLIFTVFVALVLSGCSHKPEAKAFEDLTTAEQLALNRSQVDQAVMEVCTDSVPGIHAFASIGANISSDAIVKWHAEPVFDFVNHNGGIDRTNLQIKFIRSRSGQISALLDYDYYQKQYQARQDAILRGTDPP